MDSGDFIMPKSWNVPLSRSDSILDGLSSTSSRESPLSSICPSPHVTWDLLMRSDLTSLELKFKLGECILSGCDALTDLANRIPYLSEYRIFSEKIREKTMEAKPQDVCVRRGAGEEQLFTEYIKTFIRISDAWLSVRNCFGQDGICQKKICCMDVPDLSTNYIDWMYSSQQLLQSIVQGLGKVNETCKRMQVNPLDGNWKPPCRCTVKPEPRFQQPPPLYPNPPPGFNNVVDSTGAEGGYLTPSSYDIPRNQLTESYRSKNVARAKSDIYRDLNIGKGYVIQFIKTAGKDDSILDKKFPDCKSDSEGNFSKKDMTKKTGKKISSKRRTGDMQPESGIPRLLGQRQVSNENTQEFKP